MSFRDATIKQKLGVAIQRRTVGRGNPLSTRANPNIITAATYAVDGRLFATHVGNTGNRASIDPAISPGQADTARFQGRILEVYHAIVADRERLGTVHLTYSLDDLFAELARYVGIALLVLTVSVLTAVIAASRIQRSFSQPIARLCAP